MPHSNALSDACRWLTQSLLSPLPAPLTLDWLFDEGSLTRRLTGLSDDGFSVTPLFEGWQPLRDDECAALSLVDQYQVYRADWLEDWAAGRHQLRNGRGEIGRASCRERV